MRPLRLFAMLLLLSTVAAAEDKMTVAELNTTLAGLVADHRTDEQIGLRLQQIKLSEQLTPAGIKGLIAVTNPGPREMRQLLLLSMESSLLAPPMADLPTTDAPDAAAQADLLARASSLAAKAQVPKLSADKQTIRYQNGLAAIKNTSGTGAGGGMGPGSYSDDLERVYPTLVAQEKTQAIIDAGGETYPAPVKQKSPGGPLGQISEVAPGLPLRTVLADVAKTPPTWLRWQLIGGRKTAVFAFAVPKKQSPYRIDYCCFPLNEHIGSGMAMEANSGTATEFHPFKTATGYHGELYVDAQTGVIVRLITYAEPKSTDFVSQEDIRVDYGPVQVAGTTYIVPTHSTILTTVAPNGDAFVKFSQRRTLFDVTYSNFRP